MQNRLSKLLGENPPQSPRSIATPRSEALRSVLAIIPPLIAAFASMFASAEARAVELYPDLLPPPRRVIVVPGPTPVVVVPEADPVPLLEQPLPLSAPIQVVRVRDDGSAPPAPPPILRSEERGPRLVIGGGVGPIFVLSDPGHAVAPIGHLHVGLAVDEAEFGLRVGLAPYATSLEQEDGTTFDVGLYTTDATFTYRFLPEGDVHPILGAGLGAVIAASDGRPAIGFGVSIRAGLELGVPIDEGELGVGLDVLGTQVAGAEDGFPWALATSLTTSAHLDYRF